MIIGCSGAGKSSLAFKVVNISGLRLIHMDKFYYEPNWQQVPKHKVMQSVKAAIEPSGWVFDGNHSSSYKIRSDMSEMIVWLDIPRYRCLFNILWRGVKFFERSRPSMAVGCDERFNFEFLKFVWDFKKDRRWKMAHFVTSLQNDIHIYHLKSYKQVANFLIELEDYEFCTKIS